MAATPHTRDDSGRSAYRRRMLILLILSVLLHIAAFVPQWVQPRPKTALEDSGDEPIVVDFLPEPVPQPEPPRRLVDTAVETAAPEDPTALMSDKNAVASDLSAGDDGDRAPNVEAGEFEQLGGAMPTPPPQPAAPMVTPEPEPDSEPEADSTIEEAEEAPEETMVLAANPKRQDIRMPEAAQPAPQAVAAPPTPPAEAVAPQPPSPTERDARTQSPVEGEAQNLGFLGHEAMRHELAPYMKIVRDAVEKHWKVAIKLNYNGTEPTRAVIECAIAPDGQLMFVNVADPGSSVSHAMLCKKAIEKAGPFPPFPFEVPEIYRSENLQIRWTFSFL